MLSHRAVDILTRALANPVFLSALSAWFLAQILKSFIMLFRNRPHTAKEIILNLFWTTGGMPSSHSAVVASLATSAGSSRALTPPCSSSRCSMRCSLSETRWAYAARGAQAKVLNQLIRDLSAHFSLRSRPVKEIHGHTMSEVFVGALLGFFIALAYCTL